MFSLITALALVQTSPAAIQLCSLDWDELINAEEPAYLYGYNYPVEGVKGTVDNGLVDFNVYQNGLGVVGSFTADLGNTETYSGNVTDVTAWARGTDCMDPNTWYVTYLIVETTDSPNGFPVRVY